MKLLTKEIEASLINAEPDRPSEETPIVVKFFTPDGAASWFICDGHKIENGDWLLFGFCDLGDPQMAELGYVSLKELESIRGGLGLSVERDLHYSATLADVLSQYGKHWY